MGIVAGFRKGEQEGVTRAQFAVYSFRMHGFRFLSLFGWHFGYSHWICSAYTHIYIFDPSIFSTLYAMLMMLTVSRKYFCAWCGQVS